MHGFPPDPASLVTHANRLYGPYNRWSFENELALNHVVDVWRGDGPVTAVRYALRNLGVLRCLAQKSVKSCGMLHKRNFVTLLPWRGRATGLCEESSWGLSAGC